mmetsp:Transcript_11485/g.22568  ORF Transcript_11485/g.22568 Transcript_11485/m.22568 type:complete len:300 (+) Transcript_11485:1568-2467(+)
MSLSLVHEVVGLMFRGLDDLGVLRLLPNGLALVVVVVDISRVLIHCLKPLRDLIGGLLARLVLLDAEDGLERLIPGPLIAAEGLRQLGKSALPHRTEAVRETSKEPTLALLLLILTLGLFLGVASSLAGVFGIGAGVLGSAFGVDIGLLGSTEAELLAKVGEKLTHGLSCLLDTLLSLLCALLDGLLSIVGSLLDGLVANLLLLELVEGLLHVGVVLDLLTHLGKESLVLRLGLGLLGLVAAAGEAAGPLRMVHGHAAEAVLREDLCANDAGPLLGRKAPSGGGRDASCSVHDGWYQLA